MSLEVAQLASVSETSVNPVLLFHVGTHTCALNLSHVIEIMRPLPAEAVAGAPEMVRGLSVIRGTPVPVVALAGLFDAGGSPGTRFVVVRTGDKQVALAVDAVLGIHEFAPAAYQALPPLLRNAARGVVEAIGALDSELIFVLNSASIIPDELWKSLPGQDP